MRSSKIAVVGSFFCLLAAAACSASNGADAGGTGGDGSGASSSTASGKTSSSTASGKTSSSTGFTTSTGGASSSSGGGASTTVTSSTGMGCTPGVVTCNGNTAEVCDNTGTIVDQPCPNVCLNGVGCLNCLPGTGSCIGSVGNYCLPDGSGTAQEVCDSAQGTTCNATTGRCDGACGPTQLGKSYIGCDYYPTVTANLVDSSVFHFAAIASNTTASDATVTVTLGATQITQVVVAANSVQVIELPWNNTLKGPTLAGSMPSSMLAPQAAYRLRSTQPITLYQFSPLEYAAGFSNSFTNDASLLLPANAWTGQYYVGAWHHWTSLSGFYAITASEDATTVTVTAPATSCKVRSGITGLNTTCDGTFTMNQGDIAQVVTASFDGSESNNSDASDVTGTFISADKPVQVIAGHQCTNVPDNIQYCDHLEESMFPYETLASSYLVTAPLIPTGGTTPKVEVVRIIATAANTTLTYDPPQSGAPTTIASAGGFVEIDNTAADFQVTGSSPILVVQYMEGQNAGGNSGDPASTQAVSNTQFRSNYLVHAPTNYETSYVNLVAPTGAMIALDAVQVPASSFTAIGGTGYGIARVSISNAGNGTHSAVGTMPFGIYVYGYGQYTSYWYPGGTDLQILHN